MQYIEIATTRRRYLRAVRKRTTVQTAQNTNYPTPTTIFDVLPQLLSHLHEQTEGAAVLNTLKDVNREMRTEVTSFLKDKVTGLLGQPLDTQDVAHRIAHLLPTCKVQSHDQYPLTNACMQIYKASPFSRPMPAGTAEQHRELHTNIFMYLNHHSLESLDMSRVEIVRALNCADTSPPAYMPIGKLRYWKKRLALELVQDLIDLEARTGASPDKTAEQNLELLLASTHRN